MFCRMLDQASSEPAVSRPLASGPDFSSPQRAAAYLGLTMERIRRADVPDVRTYRPDCPATLASFLEEALARDPGRRPATAAVFGARLARATHVVAA